MTEQTAPVSLNQSVVSGISIHQEKKLLLSWKSMSRPFKKRNKDFFTSVGTIAFLVAIILFFLNEILVIFVVGAFVFVVFVLSMVPPDEIDHYIFNTGIQTGQHFHPWSDLVFYRFETRWGSDILYVQTNQRFPGALYLLLGSMSREKIEQTIGTALIKRDDVNYTWMDNAAEWMSKKIPLEKDGARS